MLVMDPYIDSWLRRGPDEMQLVKALATKSGELSSIPETHVEKKELHIQFVLGSSHVWACVHIYTQTYKQINKRDFQKLSNIHKADSRKFKWRLWRTMWLAYQCLWWHLGGYLLFALGMSKCTEDRAQLVKSLLCEHEDLVLRNMFKKKTGVAMHW